MKKQFISLAFATTLALPTATLATNGYWSHGYGPKSKSMAGACVAMAFGAMCTASNPGSLVLVGNRIEAGGALFLPKRGFTADNNASPIGPPNGPASITPGEYDSGNNIFLIPHFAYNRMIDANSSIGITMGGNGGMNTEYDTAVFQNFGNPMYPKTMASSPTGMDLMQMFAGVTYSRRLNEQHSVGIAPIFALQAFEAYGLEPFTSFSKHPDKVTNNGHDMSYGAGLRLGWLWQVNDRLNIGASYQTKLWMSDFEDYKGLFADEGNFDVPANYDVGFSYKLTPKWTFAFNYQGINFEGVNAIGNASDLVFMPGTTLLGTEDGLGFGWKDAHVYKFGLQWEYNPEWTFRAGYSYASEIVPSTQALFNVLAPAVVKHHYTVGFGKKLNKDHEINVAISYMPNETVYGSNMNTGPQTGSIEIGMWDIEIGWGMRF